MNEEEMLAELERVTSEMEDLLDGIDDDSAEIDDLEDAIGEISTAVDEVEREKSIGCSCGCKSRSVPIFPAEMGSKDCGTGSGGFKPGNTCGEEEGSGDVGEARSRSVSERATLNESADRKASSLPPSISSEDVESFTSESQFREVATHVTTSDAARSIGDSGFEVRASDDPQNRTTFGRVWGDGVYLGTDAASEALYRELRSTSGRTETVRTVVDIRNPLEITYKDEPDGSGRQMTNVRNILKAAGLEDSISEMDRELNDLQDRSAQWRTERRRLIATEVDPTLSSEYRQAQRILDSLSTTEVDRIFKENASIANRNEAFREIVRQSSGDRVASAMSERDEKIQALNSRQDPLPPNPYAFQTAFMTRKLREAGFDSIIVRDEGSEIRQAGGNQIVVFDPKRVKVVR